MTRDEPDVTGNESWSLPVVWVWFQLLTLSVLVIVGVSILVLTMTGHAGSPLWFLATWFVVLGWNVYWWLFRVAYRVELVGETLRWKAPFASGALSVGAITSAGRFFGTFLLRPSSAWSPVVDRLHTVLVVRADARRAEPAQPCRASPRAVAVGRTLISLASDPHRTTLVSARRTWARGLSW
ncbi:hypothetical protein [Microbacterium sp. 13-71-7]|jgi:hypothetical protein|uniref:hypothetical protein n=1 Tax=Microbacterium sp. 13-71-7 TaxID=1970399 RepID=UPI0025E7BF9E|nr:hypothetical protein [Microbacterium sp. 13-71-7]